MALEYNILKFINLKKARDYAKKYKKLYGYTPKVFKIDNKFAVVKPKGLKRL